jgi:hypothetical protein
MNTGGLDVLVDRTWKFLLKLKEDEIKSSPKSPRISVPGNPSSSRDGRLVMEDGECCFLFLVCCLLFVVCCLLFIVCSRLLVSCSLRINFNIICRGLS